MDTDTTETVGLGQAIDKVAALAKAAGGKAEFLAIPKGSLPPGIMLDEPQILVITDGDGNVRLESLASSIENLRGKPARRKGVATATTLDSFCHLVNRNGDDATLIFLDANWRAPKVTAILNYHRSAENTSDADVQPEAAKDGDDALARFGDHQVAYAFPLSEAWKAWLARDGKLMPQGDFAEFIEDRIHELAIPDPDSAVERGYRDRFRTAIANPTDLFDLAQGLEILVDTKIKTASKLQSGERSIVFETTHKDYQGQALVVPGLFLLQIPIFYQGLAQRILVRLRYRAAGGDGVMWGYEIFRPDEVVDARIREDVAEIVHRTGRDVVDGAPEAAR